MSDGTNAVSGGTPYGTGGGPGAVDTAKQEASDLKDTATDAAKDVTGTAKDEAKAVAHETKAQAKDLFDQTRQELSEQASKQQQRLAGGLDSLGSELSSMARNSDGNGVASDLVQKASDRISGMATWLGDREPGEVMHDVKSFARRRPGAFIGGALVAGIVAGRLTRALAANAKDESSSSRPSTALAPTATTGAVPPMPPAPPVPPTVGSTVGTGAPVTGAPGAGIAGAGATGTPVPPPPASHETPLYTESAAERGGSAYPGEGDIGQGVTHERPDTL